MSSVVPTRPSSVEIMAEVERIRGEAEAIMCAALDARRAADTEAEAAQAAADQCPELAAARARKTEAYQAVHRHTMSIFHRRHPLGFCDPDGFSLYGGIVRKYESDEEWLARHHQDYLAAWREVRAHPAHARIVRAIEARDAAHDHVIWTQGQVMGMIVTANGVVYETDTQAAEVRLALRAAGLPSHYPGHPDAVRALRAMGVQRDVAVGDTVQCGCEVGQVIYIRGGRVGFRQTSPGGCVPVGADTELPLHVVSVLRPVVDGEGIYEKHPRLHKPYTAGGAA